MRTQRATQRSPRHREAETAATAVAVPRRTARAEPVAPPAVVVAAPRIQARVRPLVLEEGLFAVGIGPVSATAGTADGTELPAVQVSAPPGAGGAAVEIGFGAADGNCWLGAAGGTVVARVGRGGGTLLVTVFAIDIAAAEPTVDVRRLDASRPTTAVPGAPAPGELRCEIVLHIEREGDRRFDMPGWVGHRGERVRIEAFSVRPLEILAPGDVEYKAFGPGGRETPWVGDGKLCGTRGYGIPLTGFAVRPAPRVADRFETVYAGSFFASGVIGPVRNGAACVPTVPDDPLDAILVRLVERGRR